MSITGVCPECYEPTAPKIWADYFNDNEESYVPIPSVNANYENFVYRCPKCEKLIDGKDIILLEETMLHEMNFEDGSINMALSGDGPKAFMAMLVDFFESCGGENFVTFGVENNDHKYEITINNLDGEITAADKMTELKEEVEKLKKAKKEVLNLIDRLEYQLNTKEGRIQECYRDRNRLAVALTRMAILAGLNAGKGKDDHEDWDDEWRNVVYIDLPDGHQVSWHIAPDELALLEELPKYKGDWDGEFYKDDELWPESIPLQKEMEN